MALFLGVDGGATKVLSVLAKENGEVVGVGLGGD